MTVALHISAETDTCNDKNKWVLCNTMNRFKSNNDENVFSALQEDSKSMWTSVPRISSSSCAAKDPVVSVSGDSVEHQAHILNYVFLRGLVCNLINCGNVVGRMSQLSVALQSIPEESPLVLSPSAFPSVVPPRSAGVPSQSHTFHEKLRSQHC